MAWQSLSGGMGAGSNGGGNGNGNGNGEGQQQVNQPQGTEYTLQGLCQLFLGLVTYQVLMLCLDRGDALPADRMAQARTRSKWVGD
jgi:hypothetical protein